MDGDTLGFAVGVRVDLDAVVFGGGGGDGTVVFVGRHFAGGVVFESVLNGGDSGGDRRGDAVAFLLLQKLERLKDFVQFALKKETLINYCL